MTLRMEAALRVAPGCEATKSSSEDSGSLTTASTRRNVRLRKVVKWIPSLAFDRGTRKGVRPNRGDAVALGREERR